MTLTIYRGKDGWRWRLRARNQLVIGASTEAYRRRIDAVSNARTVTLAHLRPNVRQIIQRPDGTELI